MLGIAIPSTNIAAQEATAVQVVDERVESSMVSFNAPPHTWWYHRDLAADTDAAKLSAAIRERLRTGKTPGPGWERVSVPAPVDLGTRREFWYLKLFRLTSNPRRPVSIRLGEIDDRDRTYLNGRLIGSTGRWDASTAEAYDRRRVYDPPQELLRADVNILLVHVRAYTRRQAGIIHDTTGIGPTSVLHRSQTREDFTALVLQAVYLTAGGYFLFLFLRRRRGRENLFFGGFTLAYACYQLLRTQIKYEIGLDFATSKRLEYTLLFSLVPLFYYFVRFFFRLRASRDVRVWDRFILAVTALIAIFTAVLYISESAATWWLLQSRFILPLWLLYLSGIAAILLRRAFQGDRDALYMLGGFLLIVVGFVLENLTSHGVLNLPDLMSYFFLGFFISLASILANRFVRLHETVEDLNQNLEEKVEERTRRLNDSLEEIRTLKVQQDGDYFLTSLLVQPLGGNHARNTTSSVRIDLLTEQKKKFRFRKWKSELGGDLCAVYTIHLKDRAYTVFLNGDAMGKSVQGAGGALVLGTVFKAVVTRTQLSAAARDRYPEQWLRDCYTELQSVFTSFDGHMMVSMLFGLAEHSTGLTYYVNSEHPRLVLYREGHASFLPEERILWKVGMAEGLQSFVCCVNLCALHSGDVLIAGSDGRDDLALGHDDAGLRIMNEDEQAFLRHVEASGASLHAVREALHKAGELTDDLSLLRLEYTQEKPMGPDSVPDREGELRRQAKEYLDAGRTAEAAELIRKEVKNIASGGETDGLYGRLLLRLKRYEEAVPVLLRRITAAPADNRSLYALSRALKHTHKFAEAVDQGERLRLRQPDDLRNLLNLADAYRLQGNTDRAVALLEYGLSVHPLNENLRRLRDLCEETRG